MLLGCRDSRQRCFGDEFFRDIFDGIRDDEDGPRDRRCQERSSQLGPSDC